MLVLAAGQSLRMGKPKALLSIDNETFASMIVKKGNEAYLNYSHGVSSLPVLLITGADHDLLERKLSFHSEVCFVQNPDFERGQISSLQAGLRRMPKDADAVLVWPVDTPLVKKETVEQLFFMYHSSRMPLTIPSYHLRKGHPVIYNRAAMRTLLSLGADQTARVLRTIYADQTCVVETDDPGVLIDIDTPEEYRKYIKGVDP